MSRRAGSGEGTGAFPRPVARAILGVVLPLCTLGCGSEPPVTLGVAGRSELVDAARLAFEDAGVADWAAEIGRAVDTLFLVEDVTSSLSAIEVAEQLSATPGLVGVVGHTTSAGSLAASQIYNEHRMVQLAPISTAELYSSAGPYSFRLVPSDDQQGGFLAGVVARTLPTGGRIALLYMNNDYGRGLRSALLENLEPSAFQVAVDLPHAEDDSIFEHPIEAILSERPDLIVWLGRDITLHSLLEGIYDSLPEVPVVGSDAVAGAVQHGGDDPHWSQVRYVDFVDLDGTDSLRAFARRYEARFGRDATGPDALYYDATRLLLSGIRMGVRSGEELRSYLMSLGADRPAFEGVTGPIAFDEAGDVSRTYVVEMVRTGGSR